MRTRVKIISVLICIAIICGLVFAARSLHQQFQQKMIAEEQAELQKRAQRIYEESTAIGLYLYRSCGASVRHTRIDDNTKYCVYTVVDGVLSTDSLVAYDTFTIANSAGEYLTIYVRDADYYVEKSVSGGSTWFAMPVPEDRQSDIEELLTHITYNATKGQLAIGGPNRQILPSMPVTCIYYHDNNTMECFFTPEMRVDYMHWENAGDNRHYNFQFIYEDEYTFTALPNNITEQIDVDSVINHYQELEKELN